MRMPAADEQQLILQAKEGSHEAFRLLVERYMKHAYDVAYRFLNNHDHAEDVAQEAFVRVYRSMRTFRGDSEFGTWLYRIIVNLALSRLKQKQTTAEATRDAGHEARHFTDDTSDQMDIPMHIERALHELPTLQRAVVILRHIDGLSTKQVSSILRCSEGTVKTHLYRGLKKLRRKLQFLKEETV
jgi:RNA polymerase sigma-70 factor (ECF subfamily)